MTNPQPEAAKRYSNNNAVAVTNIYYRDTTTDISSEDARSLANKKYKINVKGDNAFPGIRIDDSITNSATFGRTVNDASGVDIGSMVFDGTNPHSTWTLKDSLNGAGDTVASLKDEFYYAYNLNIMVLLNLHKQRVKLLY